MDNTLNANNKVDLQKLPFFLTIFSIVYLLIIYYPTTLSFIRIWANSETFAHGFLIVPIALWLVWQRRFQLGQIDIKPVGWMVVLLFLVSLAWFVSYVTDVVLVQQLSFVVTISAIVIALLGWGGFKALAFPLMFLFFAVPVGESLVPYLIEFTADFTVAMVKLVGIPIFREGSYFELPSGNWSVVDACSGVRYLIASITLGVLYAYLTYQTIWKRIAFVLVSIIVPIFANGLRAFMIVMIGHLSDMRLATGVDHLVYGWVFFGIVIMIMFYIGSFWREEQTVEAQPEVIKTDTGEVDKRQLVIVFVSVISILSLLPVKAYTETQANISQNDLLIEFPQSDKWLIQNDSVTTWRPQIVGADLEFVKNYASRENKISLYVGHYVKQRKGSELVSYANQLVSPEHSEQRVISKGNLMFNDVAVNKAVIKLHNMELMEVHFYIVDGKVITNPYLAKYYQARVSLFGGIESASFVSVATPIGIYEAEAPAVLVQFLDDMGDDLVLSLSKTQE